LADSGIIPAVVRRILHFLLGSANSNPKFRSKKNQQKFVPLKSYNLKGQARADVDVFLRELEYLKYFDHPNIVRFHEVYEDENKFHLVLEYLSGGEL
jgi:calcium-dependent protein kinase